MRRYELKDKERQATLEKALSGFNEELQRACNQNPDADGITLYGGDPTGWTAGGWMLALPMVDIEVIGQYDPKKWNKFPEVKPPRGILMRAEGHYRYGGIFKGAAAWDNGVWLPLEPMTEPEDITIDRFRPWDEDEE